MSCHNLSQPRTGIDSLPEFEVLVSFTHTHRKQKQQQQQIKTKTKTKKTRVEKLLEQGKYCSLRLRLHDTERISFDRSQGATLTIRKFIRLAAQKFERQNRGEIFCWYVLSII